MSSKPSLRERQLKEQILDILKQSGKPMRMLSIYCAVEKQSDEKLGQFWREKAKQIIFDLVKQKQVKDVYTEKVKSYAWVDPNLKITYSAKIYHGDFNIPYVPPRDVPARAGAMDFLNHKSLG